MIRHSDSTVRSSFLKMLLAELKMAVTQEATAIEKYLNEFEEEQIDEEEDDNDKKKKDKDIISLNESDIGNSKTDNNKNINNDKDKSKINLTTEKPYVILTLDNCFTYLQNLDDYKPYSYEFYELFIDLTLLSIYSYYLLLFILLLDPLIKRYFANPKLLNIIYCQYNKLRYPIQLARLLCSILRFTNDSTNEYGIKMDQCKITTDIKSKVYI